MCFLADYQVGIELNQCSMKAILARKSRQGWHFEQCWDVSLPEVRERINLNDHPCQWSKPLRRCFDSLPKRHRANIALDPHEIAYRELSIPKEVADEALSGIIEKLLIQMFPEEPETLYSDFIRIGQGETVWVSVARKVTVRQYVHSLREAGINIGSIDSSVYLLRRLAQQLSVNDQTLLVHVREGSALVVAPSAYPPINIMLETDHWLFSKIKAWLKEKNMFFINQIFLTGEIIPFSASDVTPMVIACHDPLTLFTPSSIKSALLPKTGQAFAMACGLAVRNTDRLWNR